jgi:hypothetical protein
MKAFGKAGEPGDPKLKSLFGKHKGERAVTGTNKKNLATMTKRPGYATGGEVMPKAKPC